ncbi:hypothetical protein SAMN05216382_3000 [Sphingomonas palmae]|uniref:DoxX-like family protein n=1 Tax=Sphingomonas palmae TaxID=1855283 RepID=A0A1H7UJN8_9SPHN|nr:hypothetical protein [Sphingomonas palmae]SEL96517.1 hypothetical protein SAMN05216382_3000 [Sphingomonas palmae]
MLSARAPSRRWVRWWFRAAAIYGTAALVASLAAPGAATLTGLAFTLTALAFQLVFWLIGGDPVRYRPMMLAGVAEKLAFGVPALVLAPGSTTAMFGVVDLILGAGFLLAWFAIKRG